MAASRFPLISNRRFKSSLLTNTTGGGRGDITVGCFGVRPGSSLGLRTPLHQLNRASIGFRLQRRRLSRSCLLALRLDQR
ncbi:unnamed protein product [Urochloa humidicola]